MNQHDMIDIRHIFMTVMRYRKMVGYVVGGFVAVMLLYILITPSRYTAETTILLDSHQANAAADMTSSTQQDIESSFVESQVEILGSRRLAVMVLESIGHEEYMEAVKAGDAVTQENITGSIMSRLQVSRVGTTYVLSVEFTATDPEFAAKVANAYASSYMAYQLSAGHDTSTTGAAWLQHRVEELRDKAVQANKTVQEFRTEHGLYEAEGTSINESQLTEMNNRLGEARAESAAARARYEYSRRIIDTKDVNAAVAEALDNDVINTVRTNYLSSKKRLSELERVVGEDHTAVANLRQSIREYEVLLFKEMERIAQSQFSAFEIAKAREDMLETRLKELIDVKSGSDTLLTQLRALQKEAETHEALYESYLTKLEELSQKQSFPISESRIISAATVPVNASHPKTLLLLGVSVLLGMGAGVGAALYRDYVDHSLRTAAHVREILGFSFLGYMPALEPAQHPIPVGDKRSFRFADKAKTESIDSPFSIHAETIRKTKAYIDRHKGRGECKVIGVISAAPNEGKSSVAANLALYIAKTGASCLLIDADVRNPTIRQESFVDEIGGLGNVFAKEISMQDALVREARTGLSILPAMGKSMENMLEHVNPEEMGILLNLYGESFNYIVLDLPPVTATSDVYSLTPHIDHYVLVAEWGKTQWTALTTALNENDIPPQKILGTILNKADMEQLMRFYNHKIYSEYTAYSPRRTESLLNKLAG